MDTAKACNILHLESPFTYRELKKAHRKLALKTHPDRQNIISKEISTADFQQIQSAYEFLTIQLELNEEVFSVDYVFGIDIPDDNCIHNSIGDYKIIIKNFIITCLEITKTDIPEVIKSIAEKALFGLDKTILHELLQYINTYGDVLSNKVNMKIITDIIIDKLQISNIYNVNTTLDNLFQAEIFKLHVEDETYYIPLWHNEIEYDKDGTRLIVKCVLNIPDHIYIDDNNNIHVNIKVSVETVLDNVYINFFIGNKAFKIPVEELFIRKKQDFLFYKKGIPRINQEDIYNAEHIGDIIVHIALTK